MGYRRIRVRPFFLPLDGKTAELPSRQQLEDLLDEPNSLCLLHDGIFHLHPHNCEATRAEMTKGMPTRNNPWVYSFWVPPLTDNQTVRVSKDNQQNPTGIEQKFSSQVFNPILFPNVSEDTKNLLSYSYSVNHTKKMETRPVFQSFMIPCLYLNPAIKVEIHLPPHPFCHSHPPLTHNPVIFQVFLYFFPSWSLFSSNLHKI